MEFVVEKLLELISDESADKLKEKAGAEQYKRKVEAAEQTLRDFLAKHYGEECSYDEIDKLVSNHNIIPQLVRWTLDEDVSVYKEIEEFADGVTDVSLSKIDVRQVLSALYAQLYGELTRIDKPELKSVVVRVSRQLQKLFEETAIWII